MNGVQEAIAARLRAGSPEIVTAAQRLVDSGRTGWKGPLPFRTGWCNGADAHSEPDTQHARCSWVVATANGWKTCPCECHPQGHEANEVVRDAIRVEAARISDEAHMRRAKMAETETKTAKPKKAPKAKPPRDCACGCGGQTKGGEFLPGHDAKHKSNLQREYREATTKRQREKVAKQFTDRGWDRFIPVLTDEKDD